MEVFAESAYPQFAIEIVTDVFLKATILLAGAWVATVLLRRASAALRYGIWSLALGGLLVMPLVSFVLPTWEMSVPLPVLEAPAPGGLEESSVGTSPSQIESAWVASTTRGRTETPTPGVSYDAVSGTEEGASSQRGASPVVFEASKVVEALAALPAQPRISLWSWMLWAWLGGVVVMLSWLGMDLLRVWWMTRHARRAPEEIHAVFLEPLMHRLQLRRPVRLLYSDRIAMPMMWGVWQPNIILPEAACTWSPERFRLVLLHELGHVKRRDYLVHLAAQVVWSLYWPNPLAWVATRRVLLEQERACDDLVLEAGTRASTYAEHLLGLAMSLQRSGGLLGTMAMAQRSTLKERIRAILNAESDRRALTVQASLAATVIVAGLLVPLAALHLEKKHREDAANAVTRHVEALQDTSPSARQRAAWALGELEAPEAVEALVERLADAEPGVRSMAAWALGEIKAPRAVEPLIDALPDADPYVQEMVVRALGELEDERAAGTLVALLDVHEASIRAATAWALGEIRGRRALDALARIVQTDEDVHTRQTAAAALARFHGPRALQALIDGVDDAHPDVRKTIVQALATLRHPQAIGPLVAMLRQDPDTDVRIVAAIVLGQRADPLALEGLLSGLEDTHPQVREKSAWALGRIRDPRAVDALIRVLRDADPAVRAMAVWALDEIKVS